MSRNSFAPATSCVSIPRPASSRSSTATRRSHIRSAGRARRTAMSTTYRYVLPVEQTEWKFDGNSETYFTWEYDEPREALLQLYAKGKKQQWDAAERIDWSLGLDPENPMMLDDRVVHIYGTDLWNRMNERERRRVRHHLQASTISQFMHGEQGALIATAKIVQTVPELDAKFYAATQVMDEARHVEAYSRLLHEKLGIAYPITPGLKALLETVLTDRRWDMTYLGMQILIEGLALAAFQRIRDFAKNRLAASVNAYVMQDEARHVAFGRLALRDFYPQLDAAERAEREEFVVEACYHMRDRFNQKELWENLGLPVKEAIEAAMTSESMRMFRKRLFSRIVPTVKDIGLWGEKVQKAFADMGAIEFADVDSDALLEQDARVAADFDAGVFVRKALG